MKKPAKTVTLTDNSTGKQIELPVVTGSLGAPAIDIGRLYRDFGYLSYDPSFASTASCRSTITFIDGDKGQLLYRGHPIEKLARENSFTEVTYLLLYGELPEAHQRQRFTAQLRRHSMINEGLKGFFRAFYHDAHPMASMVGVVGAMSAYYHDVTDIRNPEHREIAAHRLIAKLPTIAAGCHKRAVGEPFVYPDNSLSYCGNLLHMMFSVPCEDYVVEPVAEEALDMIFTLHADHEQNASTSTVRLAGSSGANPFACIASGITALWGRAHGGANEAVLEMLDEIGTVSNIPRYLERARDRDDPFRLMGFGHRVYRNHDPRARIIRTMCHKVLERLGDINDPAFELALRLEEIALQEDYFIERKLYPNVDFYSGLIYRALGIPRNMFTVMFAVARTVGWVAQWQEMMDDPQQRIGRPRQIYVGAKSR